MASHVHPRTNMWGGEADGDVWAIVLAAGEGTRLAELTRAVYGRDVRKQFAALIGKRTFVQSTVDRIVRHVPPSRIVVVVGEPDHDVAAQQLAGFPGIQIVAQPRNLGTAVGLLLPLCHVLDRDPRARVVVFPSDHHIGREAKFMQAVRRALRVAERAPSGLALVAAPADAAATDLGWIVPGPPCDGGALVLAFVEKPTKKRAAELLRAGALWNTLVLTGRAQAMWELARREIPAVVASFDEYRGVVARPGAPAFRQRMYERLPAADLSRDLLERAEGLAVVAAEDVGWSDCGTPESLFRHVHGTHPLHGLRREWTRRRAGPRAAAGPGAGADVSLAARGRPARL